VNEDNLSRGYVALYRSVIDNPFYTQLPGDYFKVFIFCLVRAAYKPRQYWNGHAMADLPIGAFVATVGEIAAKTGVSQSTVRRALQALENSQMVVTKSTNKFSLYTVVNFEAYQNGSLMTDKQTANNWADKRQTSEQTTEQSTDKPPTNHRQTSVIREEGKKKLQPVPADPAAVEAEPSLPKFDSDKFFMEQWWPIVWSKANAKKAARKAWNRIVKDEAKANFLTERAKLLGPRYLATAEKTGSTPLYPSTWLNDERFEDEPLLPGFDPPPDPAEEAAKQKRILAAINRDLEERGLPPQESL
jgi:DNA-binding transcriptional regulator YhcF (GntR family)